MATIILLGTTGSVMADPQKVINNIEMEIEKTKEFQKKSWADARIQFGNLKKLFIKDQ